MDAGPRRRHSEMGCRAHRVAATPQPFPPAGATRAATHTANLTSSVHIWPSRSSARMNGAPRVRCVSARSLAFPAHSPSR